MRSVVADSVGHKVSGFARAAPSAQYANVSCSAKKELRPVSSAD
jgi:hypothetical protein